MTQNPLRKHLVLVVDKDPSALYTLQVALVSHGYYTLADQSAHGAIEHLKQRAIDAIVLDPRYLENAAEEVFQEIRQLRPSIPIVIVSTEPFEAFSNAALTRFIAKPLLPASLRESVDSLIEEVSCCR